MDKAVPRKIGGQNKVNLSEDQVRQVEVLSRHGLRMEDVAEVFGIGIATIKRIAARDQRVTDALTKARNDRDRKVVDKAFEMAMSGKHPAMTIFWLKARMGWRETQRLEHTGAEGAPIRTQTQVDLSRFTKEQLKNLEQAMEVTDASAAG